MPKPFPIRKARMEPFRSLYEFRRVLRQCHHIIWRSEGYDPTECFDEMSKILFIKMFDERLVKEEKQKKHKFAIYTNEPKEETVKRVQLLFEKAKKAFPEIFKEAEREYRKLVSVNLKDKTLYEIVEVLQGHSLLKTEVDVKGATYEFFLKGSFRGVMGQYFTPREIVEFMVHFVKPKRTYLVLDPACGSGGFLVEVMKTVWKQIDNLYKNGRLDNPSKEKKNFATQNLHGMDINARMSWVARMNMVMHGNGHGNIRHCNALVDAERARKWGFEPETFEIVLTNPPFGSRVTDQETLKNYELAVGRKSQLTEVLFLERCLLLLAPEGKMGIVLPDSILTNLSLKYVRDFIRKKAIIEAVVSLPIETFNPYGSGIKASLLFLKKKDVEGKMKQGDLFMANAHSIGYDATGRAVKKKDLPIILKKWNEFEGKR